MKEKNQEELLQDLLGVGPLKPLGYLPLETLEDFCNKPRNTIISELEKRGIQTRVFTPEDVSHIWSGALFAYDEATLKKLLANNIQTLAEAGWPIEPSQFVETVASKVAEPNTPLYRLIADAFADFSNPLRSRPPKVRRILGT